MSIVLPSPSITSSSTMNGRQVDVSIEQAGDASTRLAAVFLVSLGVMVVLASVLFAATEGGVIPAVAAVLTPFALYTVDRHRWLSLPNFWAGFLGLVALLAAFIEFISGDIEARLLSGGHFMCYLTWIVLWQRKEWRQYWMLSALSILQVAVGSLLSNSHWLGVGLLLYIVVALWMLSIFTMYRMEAVSSDPQARRIRAAKSRVWFPVDGHGQRPHSAFSDANIRVTGRFVGISLAVICASLAFAAVAYLLIPRVWVGQFQIFDNSPLPGSRSLTGFTNEVRLGDLGQILENSDPVMDVQFFDNQSGTRLSLSEAFELLESSEPLFRGVVLEQYFAAGRWQTGDSNFGPPSRRQSSRDFLRQEIKLHPIGTNAVFATGNPIACIGREPAETIYVNNVTRTFSRDNNANLQSSLRYYALSRLGDSISAVPPSASWRPGNVPPTLQVPVELQSLVSATRERLSETDGLETDREKALFLEGWLRDSGEFSYTLSLSISDPNADPIHDFFFNRKSGHCEYFAATLTMMLRSAGIHARMVSGFKGGVVDTTTNILKVQQLHAHAWVEAWIDEQWLQLDPTPATRDVSVSSIESSGVWKLWLTRFQNVWNDGLTWSKEDQDALIYDPVAESFKSAWDNVKSPAEGLQQFLTSTREFLSDPSKWFSWQGGLAVIVISLIGIGITKFIKFLLRMIRRQRDLAATRESDKITVAFYARWEALLKRLALTRSPAETPLEFADQARGRFQSLGDGAGWPSDLPSEVAHSFYSVRFGGNTLDGSLATRIDRELDALEERIRTLESAASEAS